MTIAFFTAKDRAHKLDGLYVWGGGANGRLGLNDANNRSYPVQLNSSVGWNALAASAYTFAIRSDGALFSWGLNEVGQLGHNDLVTRSSPVQVGTSSWTAVGAGNGSPDGHCLAIRVGGSLFAWGGNTLGQLGLNDIVGRSSPVQVGALTWNAVACDSASNTSYGIRSDGALFAWGQNTGGQIGDNTVVTRSSPVQVGSPNSWAAVASGSSFAIAIRSDGGLFTWGINTLGQQGSNQGATAARSVPTQVGLSSWTAVAAGLGVAFAIRIDGALFSWGDNSSGALGQNDLISRSSPTQVGLSSWTAISYGNNQAAAIQFGDGALFAWGPGGGGAPGQNDIVGRSSPIQVGGLTRWLRLATGTNFHIAVADVP